MRRSQSTNTRGNMARMMSRVAVTAAMTLAILGVTAPAEATQPPPRCKVLSVSQELQWVGQIGRKQVQYTVTTTTRRCRGKVVTTVTYAYRLPFDGPR